jgi:hypothetical protein
MKRKTGREKKGKKRKEKKKVVPVLAEDVGGGGARLAPLQVDQRVLVVHLPDPTPCCQNPFLTTIISILQESSVWLGSL